MQTHNNQNNIHIYKLLNEKTYNNTSIKHTKNKTYSYKQITNTHTQHITNKNIIYTYEATHKPQNRTRKQRHKQTHITNTNSDAQTTQQTNTHKILIS